MDVDLRDGCAVGSGRRSHGASASHHMLEAVDVIRKAGMTDRAHQPCFEGEADGATGSVATKRSTCHFCCIHPARRVR